MDLNMMFAARVDDLVVRRANAGDNQHWDSYVTGHPDGTLFHRFGWADVISRAFAHPVYFLLAERGRRVVGVLPLIHKKSRLFGDALVSTPYCSYGGVIADNDDVARSLEDHAELLGRELNVGFVEMRNRRARRDDWLRMDSVYVTFRRSISDSDNGVICGVSSKGRRRRLRQSLRSGLHFRLDSEVSTFYRLLSESYRNLGTPIFSKRYFALLLEVFAQNIEIYIVGDRTGPLTASLAFYFRDEVHPIYVGGGKRARRVQANDFLYLRMMARAYERGARIFDFGRSKVGTGAFDNKRDWGAELRPLCYEYKLISRTEPLILNPLDPKFRMMVAVWKRLPLSISRLIGPVIGPHLG